MQRVYLGMMLAVFAWMPATARAPNRLPQPTGIYPVGRTTLFWTDSARANRPVRVDIWFPANAAVGDTADYFPDLGAFVRSTARDSAVTDSVDALLRPLLNAGLKSNAHTDASLAEKGKPFPVLLFSHGLGQSPFAYGIQLEDLASHGFIVVAPSHVGDALGVRLADGTVVRFDREFWAKYPPDSTDAKPTYEAHHRMFAEDLIFALNQMVLQYADARSLFYRALDLNRVGAFGHSSGGRAAAGACLLDSRFRACMNQDGGLHRQGWPSRGLQFRGAFAVLDWFDPGLSAEDLAGMRTNLPNYARPILRPSGTDLEIYREPSAGAYRLTLLSKGMLHTAFLDLRWLSAASTADRMRFEKYLSIIRETTNAFFDQSLNGATSPLLNCERADANLLVQCFKPARTNPQR